MWNRNERTAAVVPSSHLVQAPRPTAEEARPTARVGPSIVIKGEVSGAEDFAIDGQVEGRIELPDHRLTIGVGASIRAEVIARTVTIRGAVTGNVTAREIVHICETGSVDGDIRAPRFAMSDGGVLSGRVDTRSARAAAHVDEPRLFPVAV
jgi:cytoskeletal protein CcmA (bactofilin family)